MSGFPVFRGIVTVVPKLNVWKPLVFFPVFLAWAVFFAACTARSEYRQPAAFFSGGDGVVLYGLSPEAAAGRLALAGPASLTYVFEPPLEVPPGFSLEAGYRVSPSGGGGLSAYQLVLETDPASSAAEAWELPLDAAFLGLSDYTGAFRYAAPARAATLRELRITFRAREGGGERQGAPGGAVLEFSSLRLVPRWFGFAREQGVLAITPFVFAAPGDPPSLTIDPPAAFRTPGPAVLSLREAAGAARIRAGENRFVFTPGPSFPSLSLPPAALGTGPYPAAVSVNGGGVLPGTAFWMGPAPPQPAASRDPIPLDPGLVLPYPQDAWREPGYEVFRWPAFPGVLIFDTADYAVQERLFKRLAFFVEKRDFRGRLVSDRELAGLHGWNAHDYRDEDLARFFERARQEDFPLLDEEWELLDILLHTGVVVRAPSGEIRSGNGAVLSISRESPDHLRRRFMVHEGFHGIFFMDEGFREFSRRRWENLDAGAKRAFSSYLDFQRYDLADPYLVVNEFMAYCLQQPASQAGPYFGETVPRQILSSPWRRSDLPPSEQSPAGERWPVLSHAFIREVEAFSAYVFRHWGLAAGQVSLVTVDFRE
ncbi:MAG: hypothetical protein LBH70_03995 [Spirochaetaceae bacterium]|jgi:hypothetical protein|nr:hypothetical protein [Spirochaetaceae bacterium]